MSSMPPSMRDLGERLLAHSSGAGGQQVVTAAAMCDRLRAPLVEFAGTEGYVSLFRRALRLACLRAPVLESARIDDEGRLLAVGVLAGDKPRGDQHADVSGEQQAEDEAAVALIESMLELLVTFIGKPLTIRLVRKAWPGAPLDEWYSTTGAER